MDEARGVNGNPFNIRPLLLDPQGKVFEVIPAIAFSVDRATTPHHVLMSFNAPGPIASGLRAGKRLVTCRH
jgi:hypothetical protein